MAKNSIIRTFINIHQRAWNLASRNRIKFSVIRQSLMIFTFHCLFILSANGQKPVYVEANRYNLTIINNFNHHLKVYATKGRKNILQQKVIGPGERHFINNKFSRSKLKKIKVHCIYDDETYQKDIIIINKRADARTRELNKQKQDAEKSIQEDFFYKIGYHAMSTSSGETLLSEFKRFIGALGKTYYTLKESWMAYQKKNYNNYEELFKDLENAGVSYITIKYLSASIQNKFGIKASTSEYVIKAILYYIQQSTEIENFYTSYLSKINDHKDQEFEAIKKLKTDVSFESTHIYSAYNIAVKPLDMKTITPNFTLTIDPFISGNRLNEYFLPLRDALMESQGSNKQLDWSDGLWNKYLGGSFGFNVSPEMRLSKKGLYSKIYASVGVHHFGYKLHHDGYRLGSQFFSTVPQNSLGFILSEPIRFEQTNISGALTWRFIIKRSFIFDILGGYIHQNSILNLSQSELSQGYSWSQDKIRIVDDQIVPFGGVRLGLGANRFHNGTHLSVGANFYHVNHSNITDFIIKDSADNDISFGSNRIHFKIYTGMTFAF